MNIVSQSREHVSDLGERFDWMPHFIVLPVELRMLSCVFLASLLFLRHKETEGISYRGQSTIQLQALISLLLENFELDPGKVKCHCSNYL